MAVPEKSLEFKVVKEIRDEVISSNTRHFPETMALFGGALLLRGAGCTINDLLDWDIDTKTPLVSFDAGSWRPTP
ncbi:4-hydroxybenzoate polyprenyltransferase, mitochondrial [Corchorus olitorius]|uniref:4-hydroxybenzoate polyprenyltransferase, mitochondrial n=1 Tax=Corchorus olitorius TaxID=93759 RepID=A0A1R3ID40_9ROSI|nr:4-hydroxybenzoate polyprenyltransferase, mitochondrial [Corchorus olitorius]